MDDTASLQRRLTHPPNPEAVLPKQSPKGTFRILLLTGRRDNQNAGREGTKACGGVETKEGILKEKRPNEQPSKLTENRKPRNKRNKTNDRITQLFFSGGRIEYDKGLNLTQHLQQRKTQVQITPEMTPLCRFFLLRAPFGQYGPVAAT